MKKRILCVFAHPDDESFMVGGTIRKYVDDGWIVDVLCFTRGEAGQYGPYEETEDLRAIRTKELEEAAKVLGISSVKFFDYPDGKLSEIHPGELEDKLYKAFLQYEPDVIITFESKGITNHPDHRKLCISTTYAFQKYAKRQIRGEQLGRRDPRRLFVSSIPSSLKDEPKLYYVCMPESVVGYLKAKQVIPEESFGKPWVGVPDKLVTTCIDISDYTEIKVRALSKYKTQIADVERFLSIDIQPLMYKEYFILRMQGEQEIFMGNNDTMSDEL
ncbi:MAG: PIG-L family deacetylase [Patescibacteria group bacterium]|nr:PIG-L family deacetylase [Patescibacteria group bacterium]